MDALTARRRAMSQGEVDCPFDRERITRPTLAGNDRFAAIYNVAPIVPGHSLVVPRRHVERFMGLNESELCQFFVFARRVTDMLMAAFEADGFDWSIQDGESAGQTV